MWVPQRHPGELCKAQALGFSHWSVDRGRTLILLSSLLEGYPSTHRQSRLPEETPRHKEKDTGIYKTSVEHRGAEHLPVSATAPFAPGICLHFRWHLQPAFHFFKISSNFYNKNKSYNRSVNGTSYSPNCCNLYWAYNIYSSSPSSFALLMPPNFSQYLCWARGPAQQHNTTWIPEESELPGYLAFVRLWLLQYTTYG